MKKIYFSILICIVLCVIAAFTFAGCSGNALDRPIGLRLDGPTLTLSWKENKDAKYYVVSISGNGVEDEKNTRKNSLSLVNLGLGEGDYQLKVKACAGGGEFADSDWSEPITFSQDKDTGLVFRFINNNKEAEVVSLGKASGDVTIPDTYRGAPVTKIGDRAFAGKSALKSIVISDRVTQIGSSAFYNCASLERLTFSKNLTSIGESAFQSCRSLSGTLAIPENVTQIGKLAFAYCTAVTELKLNTKLQSVGESAFSSCTELKTLSIPDSVKTIGNDAFSLCGKLTEVHFGSQLTQIGEYSFASCGSLENIVFNAGLKYIGKGAFMSCAKLDTVTFSDTVEYVGDGAFYQDALLANVTFGSRLRTIGASAFDKTAVWENSSNEVYLNNWFLGFKDQSAVGSRVDIEAGTVGIANFALAGLGEGVSSVILPDSVKIIGSAAFATSKISSVVIGSGAEEIGLQAFAECDKLTMVILGAFDVVNGNMTESSLKVINEQAFFNCAQLASIEIPETVETIGSYAFNGTALYNNAADGIAYAGNWLVGGNPSKARGSVAVKDGTVGIANYAFYKCANVSDVEIPDSVKTIGRAAFYLCSNLTSVRLPDGLETIDDYTFYNCSKLILPVLPETLKTIGRSAFYKCALSNGQQADTDSDVLVIPDSVQTIGDYAFFSVGYTYVDSESGISQKGGIDSVQFGSGITRIGANAFYSADSLKSVTLGDNVQTIGEKAFYKCPLLSEINFNDALQSIGARAFYNCNGITSLTLSNGIKEIGDYAFYKCEGLTEVKLGSGVERIGDYAFYGCGSLAYAEFSDSVTSIGKQAFRSCAMLKSVTLGGKISSIDAHAFYGCNSLTVYAESSQAPAGWNARFNSAYRPIVWGCTLRDGYVYSLTKNANTISNFNSANVLSDPQRAGYKFAGWSTSISAAEATYSTADLVGLDNGVTLYAVWTVNNSEM